MKYGVWFLIILTFMHRNMSQRVTQSSHEQVILVHGLLSWFLNLHTPSFLKINHNCADVSIRVCVCVCVCPEAMNN